MKTFKLNSEAEICEKSNLTITVDMTAKQVTTNGMSKDGTVEFSECGLENEEESEIQDFFIERYEEDFNITVKFQ